MSKYMEAAQNFNELYKKFYIEETQKASYLSDSQKAEKIEETNKQYEYRLKEEMAIAKVLEKEGADFFSKSPETQEKILSENLLNEGILQRKTYESGESYMTYADGFHYYPPAGEKNELATRAQEMVTQEAVRLADNMRKDPLNAHGEYIYHEFQREYNSQSSVSAMAKIACKFMEKEARAFTKDSLDLTATTSEETKNKTVVGEEEFKGLLAERVKDLEKIKEFENNPDQRYYGDGLMVAKDSATQTYTCTIDGQQIDKDTACTLVEHRDCREYRDKRLEAGVQYGSLIGLYNPESKGENGQYKEMKWLTADGNGGLKEVSKEDAQQIHDADIKAGKDVSAKEVKVENYGGGLVHLKDQNGKSTYMNANNITHPNTGKSYNMVHSQIMAQAREGGR